ncbi:metallophosphoesterase 1 homolog [Toxorhynchites rutilus septentrionalis]|uniref:metallophosphoesterase 1 homolog n=1 Tax=Toxorhynchites rutilus septentrionalis TaxID=329112 RepID=UPI00247B1789|nr:metallophosphoesterase 1 homolog [Toxorhynchites rutilus septentrionalis]
MKLRNLLLRVAFGAACLLVFNEFIVYYLVLLECQWPTKPLAVNGLEPVKVMLLADTHLLGPIHGHWFDRLRREWQMHRTFQSAMTLFRPEVVFVLGDIFDEGNWVNQKDFDLYVERFRKLFHTPEGTQLHSIVGNHDIGFHYATHPYLVHRFGKKFNNTGVSLDSIRGVNFVSINSIAMEGDGCQLCETAEKELRSVSAVFKCGRGIGKCENVPKLEEYSQPIILQHFPMHRDSDKLCKEHDSPEMELYRERWEVISKESTDLIGELLNPRLAFSGHSHHFCYMAKNRLGIEEYTLPSFSWRNKNNPSFILAQISLSEHSISRCQMPVESTIINIYLVGAILLVLTTILRLGGVLSHLRIFSRGRREYKKLIK